MSSDVDYTYRKESASLSRAQQQTDVSPSTDSGIQIKGLFYKSTNFVIHGGTFSVIRGNVHNYVGSTHNERSFNSKVANTRDSYNDSSTSVREEYTRSEAGAIDGTESVSCAFLGEGRELGTGKKVSGEGTQEIQERRRRLANAALRRISRKLSFENSRDDPPQQSQQKSMSDPNGGIRPGSVNPSSPTPPSDSSPAQSESDSSEADSDEELDRFMRTKHRKKKMTRKSSANDPTMPTETQVQSQNFSGSFAPTNLQSPTSGPNIRMRDPFGFSQMQSPPLVAHQPMSCVPGYPFALHEAIQVPPAFPRPHPCIYKHTRFQPQPMPSPTPNTYINPHRKATNPFVREPTLPLPREGGKR